MAAPDRARVEYAATAVELRPLRKNTFALGFGNRGDEAVRAVGAHGIGDALTRCITPVISADEIRRYGYQWFLLDIAFGKPKGWAVGRLERMWMAQGEGGQRLFIIPALQLVIAMTAGNTGRKIREFRRRGFCGRSSSKAFANGSVAPASTPGPIRPQPSTRFSDVGVAPASMPLRD